MIDWEKVWVHLDAFGCIHSADFCGNYPYAWADRCDGAVVRSGRPLKSIVVHNCCDIVTCYYIRWLIPTSSQKTKASCIHSIAVISSAMIGIYCTNCLRGNCLEGSLYQPTGSWPRWSVAAGTCWDDSRSSKALGSFTARRGGCCDKKMLIQSYTLKLIDT